MSRQFSQEESAAILRRTIELHSAQNGEAGSSDQSLEELQRTAAELGIDPALVERAASELGALQPRSNRLDSLIGGPFHIEFVRQVKGRIAEDSWATTIDTIRQVTGRIGNPRQVGSMFEWISSEPDSIHVSFVPDGDGTRVRTFTAIGGWACLLFLIPPLFAVLIAGIVGAINHFGPALEAAFIICSLTATLLGARHFFSRISTRRQKLMKALSESLANSFEEDRRDIRTHLADSNEHVTTQSDSSAEDQTL